MTDFKKTLCKAGLMEGRIAKVYAHGIDICEKLKLKGLVKTHRYGSESHSCSSCMHALLRNDRSH